MGKEIKVQKKKSKEVEKNEFPKKKISKGKKVLYVFFIIVLLLAYKYFFGCALKVPIATEHPNEMHLDEKMVEVSLKKDTLSRTGVTLEIKNNSEYDISYGYLGISLEYSMFNNWFIMVPKRFIPRIARGIYIYPNETREIEYNWKDEYGRLSLGKYRVVINISVTDEDDLLLSEKYRGSFVSYEFWI